MLGNSGGAVANANSKIVGLSEAYLPPSSGAVSIGFVTPSATVTDIADQLLTPGRAKHAYLGIQPEDITPQVAEQFPLDTQSGALVLSVSPNGPAAAAGITVGAVITMIGQTRMQSVTDLLTALHSRQPNTKVMVTVLRSSSRKELTVTLSDRPPR